MRCAQPRKPDPLPQVRGCTKKNPLGVYAADGVQYQFCACSLCVALYIGAARWRFALPVPSLGITSLDLGCLQSLAALFLF